MADHPASQVRSAPPSETLTRREHLEAVLSGVRGYTIFVLDPAGNVQSWNDGAERMTGYAAREIVGRHFATFFPEEIIRSGIPEATVREATSQGHAEIEGWYVTKDGSRIWCDAVLTALPGPQSGLLVIIRDLSERKRAEESLRQTEERFRLLVQNVVDYAIFMLDRDGRVSSWNEGAAKIKGYSAAEVIGKPFDIFYPREATERGWPAEELRRAEAEGRFEDRGWRVRKDGSQFFANVVITALRDEHGELRGFSKITRDLTRERLAEDQLQRAHREMEARVEERTADLSTANEALRRENSERLRLEAELRRAVQELRDLDEQKNEFLAALAHELRNPLAPIRTAIGFLRLRSFGEAAVDDAHEVIDRQMRLMSRLVDDLLDLSRITRNRLQLRREAVTLQSLVKDALDTTRPFIEQRGQELLVQLPDEPLVLHVDPARIVQMLSNLLHNAAKFTPTGGMIQLVAQGDTNVVRLKIIDNGIGIRTESLSKVFELFSQLELPSEWPESGLGIGLSLVRRIVQLHGGNVSAASAGPGHGAEFAVELPLDPEIRKEQPVDEKSVVSGPLRILVVDDNRDAADTLRLFIAALGHDVRTAYDGLEAYEAAAAFRPHVIFLDIGMPKMNGYDTAKRLRAEDWGKPIVIVAVTGWGQEGDRQRSAEAGFDRHLVKPADPADVQDIIAQAASGGIRTSDVQT